MSAWYDAFKERIETKRPIGALKSVIEASYGDKTVYRRTEQRPGRSKTHREAQLPSKNNKHPYIFKGRYM